MRHPAKVRRLVLAASNIRADGYHPEIDGARTGRPAPPDRGGVRNLAGRLRGWRRTRPTSSRSSSACSPSSTTSAGWTAEEIRSITAPTFLVIGDRDFVRLDHAAEMLDLFPDCRLAVLPATATPR